MTSDILLLAKALHIIFVVAWFAGLFYIPRLLIYQVEAQSKEESARIVLTEQFKLMEKRLWNIITWPAMIIAISSALVMLWLLPGYLQMPWMHVKLGFVGLLIAYHFSLYWLYLKQKNGLYPMTGTQLRFYNELATLLLFAIIFTVVFKNTMSWAYGAGGLLVLGVVLTFAIMAYKKFRNRNSQ